MYKICVVKDHGAGTLTISCTDGLKRVFDDQKANFLAVGFVNDLKLEDLGINLADEEVYQLIVKANKAEYSYNQVKSQRF